MRHRSPRPFVAACSLLAVGIAAGLHGRPAMGQDVVRLNGEMFIGGATLVDPPPGEAKNTHAYLTVTGPAALRLYRGMTAKEEDDLCRGDGHKVRRAGALSCSIAAGGREAVCDFGVDLRSGTLAGGRPC
jgi:hypothetical protein